MKIITKHLLLSLSAAVILLGGWSSQTLSPEHNPLFEKIENIQSLINESKWEEAISKARRFDETYEKQKGKLQLLGDEDEYEYLERELSKFTAAVEQKIKTEAKIKMASIITIFKEIYSL